MIRLQRDLGAVHPSFRGAKRIALERALLELRRAGKPPKSSVWKNAKDQLKAESFDKCGYCEANTSVVAHGDVEHFRPKTIYWWLAYCYDNYIFACQVCNQTFKGSNFPLAGPALAGPPVVAGSTDQQLDALAGTLGPDPLDANAVLQYHATGSTEIAHLPDPYAADPERLFGWRADDTLREVLIEPRDATPAARDAFGAVDAFLGLNRDELKRLRYETLEAAELLAEAVQSGQLSAALTRRMNDELRRMMSPSGQFAGMVRFKLAQVPGLLPLP